MTSVAGERDYTIKYITDRDTLALRARLGRIGNRDVLDVWPTTDGMQGPYGALFTPTHLVFVAEIGNDEARLAPLLGDSVVAVMARAHNDLMHTRHSDDVVLHGSTRQLRSSLASAIAAPSSRDSVILWRRSASRDK